jgi:hypothetical protein
MELCWLYACADFTMDAVAGRAFPFEGAVAAFLCAVALTSGTSGRGWRVVWLLLSQAAGVAAAAAFVVHQLYYPAAPLFSAAWLSGFIDSTRGAIEWVYLILLLLWAVALWYAGVMFARRPRDYFTVCHRFDLGLAAFFVLFLFKCVIIARTGMQLGNGVSALFVYPFFLLGLLAIATARIERAHAKRFLPGFHGFGIAAGFASGTMLAAAGLVLFFLPALSAGADVGYRALKATGKTLIPLVVGVVRFMMTGKIRPEPAGAAAKSGAMGWQSSAPTGWWAVAQQVVAWGFWAITLLVAAFVAAILIYSLIRLLMSKTARASKTGNTETPFFLFVRFWRLLVALYHAALRGLTGYSRAAQLYGALDRWGKHNGLDRTASETPAEFAARLGRHFPGFTHDIDSIVDAFHTEAYSARRLEPERFARARSAWYRLRSPLHWPSRLKVRLSL